jgi:tetratricopeptide (TPR) repeat protein
MKKLFIYLHAILQLVINTALAAQTESKKDTDSIEIAKIYQKVNHFFFINTDSSRLYAREGIKLAKMKGRKYEEGDGYFYVAISYNIDNKFDSAIYYYEKCLPIFKEIKANKACAVVLSNIGELCFKNGKHEDAHKAYIESLSFYKKIDNKEGTARNYFNISVIHKQKGDYQTATDYLFKALSIFEQSLDTFKTALTLQELGNVYIKQKNYEKTTIYYQKAIETISLSSSIYKKNIIGGLKNNLAIVYKKTGNFNKAIETYNEALSIHKEINNNAGIANVYLNLGEIYNQLKDYEKALDYNDKSLLLSKQLNDPYLIAFTIYNRGSIYRGLKSYDTSLKLFHEALSKTKALNNKELEKSIVEELSQAYESIGDFKNAFHYHKQFKSLNDSLFNDETTRKITTLELQYEFDKKQRKQEFTQKQKELVFEERINRQKLLVKASFIVSALLILLLFTGFGYYRNKQIAKMRKQEMELNKNNQQLLSQQMNPHFIFNCLNSIRNLIIENKTEDTDKYFVTFANLMRNNLEYSQHTAIPIKDEIGALQLYVSLEQLRFKNKFTFTINIDGEIDQHYYKIPSLLLQPFVENAIIHGIRNKENGAITIVLSLKDKEIFCAIDDNGVGRDLTTQSAIKNHKSYGTQLTQQRLELIHKLYGNASKLKIIDKKDGSESTGTRIEFGIPIIV